MNIVEKDIILYLSNTEFTNQRTLSTATGYSLGSINKALQSLIANKYLDSEYNLTKNAKNILEINKPKNAIILAAGFGMRMVPINTEMPKGLITIQNETLIERLICQLQEVGITDIHIVVGFMKEHYEFLIDKYDINLIVNNDYSTKNNLFSLNQAISYIGNTYIIPCDIWSRNNPFSSNELYSWYMVSEKINPNSKLKISRQNYISYSNNNTYGNQEIGISYITQENSKRLKNRITNLCSNETNSKEYWEASLFDNNIQKFPIAAKVAHSEDVFEINTYEQLREYDSQSKSLNIDAIKVLTEVFNTTPDKIVNIEVLKKGMTNRSFTFEFEGKKYVMRIPGEGTSELINRQNELDVYNAIQNTGLCSDPIYINAENGFKVTKFLYDVRCCDPHNVNDLKICMDKLKELHNLNLKVNHEFDIFKQIEFYEKLRNKKSVYRDYDEVKKNIFSLKPFIEKNVDKKVLSHIDAIPDNFLFYSNNSNEELQLTDWEYAGMQDPHIDLAMFSIYSYYNKEQADKLIDIYFDNKCTKEIRVKIYCYIAVCGLLWSNWCEYKQTLGVEFGEYSLQQYRYAKDFYRIVKSEGSI